MMRYYFLKSGEKAQALIVAYTVIAVFMIISASLLSRAISENNLALRNRLTNEAFYLAEGGIESAINAFASAMANFQIEQDVASFSVITTYSTFGGATVNSTITRLESSDHLVMEGETNVWVRNYEVVSTATHPQNSSISATIHQIIARRLIPTFQHAVFYNDDLEILPGRDMTLSGRIHANKDIYLDAEGGATLTIDSFYLRSAGSIYNHRKNSSDRLGGDVSIRVDKPGAPQFEYMDNLDSESPNWTAESISRWQGTVKNSVHGITKQSTPAVGSIKPTGYYANNANVVIVNDTITKDGVALTEGLDYPAETITSETVYNNREGKNIKTTTVDLKKLAGGDGGYKKPDGVTPYNNNLPTNGLLYATRDDAATTEEPGIRLKNGEVIYRNVGLTVVSNDPVYIQGNYNSSSGQEKPTAVICDSLNLLSGNWDDANSTSGLSSRTATETTVNAAFIAGVRETTKGPNNGNYNGGLENYPRLHEDWSGINLNIKGSFVELWNSSVATGAWQYGDPQYNAPRRSWSYNTAFNNPSNLPPFTPKAVEVQRIAWRQ